MTDSTETDIVELLEALDNYIPGENDDCVAGRIKESAAAIRQLRAERDAAAREEAWMVTQSGLAVSMWLTEIAATKVLDSYKRSTKGKGNWAVERITVIRAMPNDDVVIATCQVCKGDPIECAKTPGSHCDGVSVIATDCGGSDAG